MQKKFSFVFSVREVTSDHDFDYEFLKWEKIPKFHSFCKMNDNSKFKTNGWDVMNENIYLVDECL